MGIGFGGYDTSGWWGKNDILLETWTSLDLATMVDNVRIKIYAVTGTFHGSIIYSVTEGDARRLFHKCYNGESILTIKLKPNGWFPL